MLESEWKLWSRANLEAYRKKKYDECLTLFNEIQRVHCIGQQMKAYYLETNDEAGMCLKFGYHPGPYMQHMDDISSKYQSLNEVYDNVTIFLAGKIQM